MNETTRNDLLRIEKQAELLAKSAATLRNLHGRHDGMTPASQPEIRDQTQRMQAAFMAVLRVTAEYL